MIAISTKKIEKTTLLYKDEIDDIVTNRGNQLGLLLNDCRYIFTKYQLNYITTLYNNIEVVIKTKPDKLRSKFPKLFNEIPKSYTKDNLILKKYKKPKFTKKTFKDLILETLNYSKLRSDFYPKYFKEIGIKACVYCNSQLAVSIDSNGKDKAKFQLDHYLSKSKYPCFSISFYNLYPVCASCNIVKGDKNIEFELYSDDKKKTNKSKFNFLLEKGSVAKFLISRNYSDIEYTFEEPSKDNQFQKTFDIQGIYDTQKDIIEELILKKEIYTKSYKHTLKSSFPKLFNNSTSLSNRIIIGNYSFADEIHKRPMAKFTQDIASQLKLID